MRYKMYGIVLNCLLVLEVSFEFIEGLRIERNCIALILARGGSKQVPRKNLAMIQNVSLLKRAIDAARAAEVFSEIWVSTDDTQIHKEAKIAGAKVYARSEETANDTASSLDAILEFSSFFPNVRCIALLQCTSPFQSALYLRKAYFLMTEFQYDSVFSVVRSFKLRWKKNLDGSVSPINFELNARPRRQDMIPEYVENGMFYLFSSSLLQNGYIQGGKTGVVEIPSERSIEIDTYDDLKYARFIAASLLPTIMQESFMCCLDEEYWHK